MKSSTGSKETLTISCPLSLKTKLSTLFSDSIGGSSASGRDSVSFQTCFNFPPAFSTCYLIKVGVSWFVIWRSLVYNALSFWILFPDLVSTFLFSALTHSNGRWGCPISIPPRSYRDPTAASGWTTCDTAQLSLSPAEDWISLPSSLTQGHTSAGPGNLSHWGL